MSGDSAQLYVSYHGGSKGCNNLDLIDGDGFVHQNVLGEGATLDELRGLAWAPDGDLWVVSGAAASSEVLSFAGSAGQDGVHAFIGIQASGTDLPAISHPFDIAFVPGSDSWFVSNQDTNVVAGPMPDPPPMAPYLGRYTGGTFLTGTFVASARTDLATPPTPEVPQPQGLAADPPTGRVKHSVRGLVHDGERLYVADEAAGEVKGYDATTGELEWQFKVEAPVHLLLDGGDLLVGAGDQVVRVHIQSGEAGTPTKVKSVSGLALDGDCLYAASRTHNRICAGPEGGELKQYGPTLKDEPEFILLAA